MNTFFIIATYWAIVICITLIIRWYNKPKYSNIFAEEEKLSKKIYTFLGIVLVIPPCVPFILVYVLYSWIIKQYYKNRPRPVSKKNRQYLKKDTVLDETRSTISLSEYNYRHQTSYTLDDVYGKGYTESLTDEEKAQIRKEDFGVLTIQEEIPNDIHVEFGKALGQALLDGEFSIVSKYLDACTSLVLYGNKSMTGRNAITEYWKGWRERYILTRKAKNIEVVYNNYYSNACLRLDHMLVMFSFNKGVVANMMLSRRYLNSGIGYCDDIMDFPFSYNGIKSILTPLREDNEFLGTIDKCNRIPCFKCGIRSEKLNWHGFKTEAGSVGYSGQVTICPNCGRVVEFYPEIRYRFDPKENNQDETDQDDLPF